MSEGEVSLLVVGASAVVAVLLIVILARKSSRLSERLLRLAASFGWEAPQRIWWSGAIRARWRGMAVELRHMYRQKGVPERRVLIVNGAASAGRVIRQT